MISLQDALKLNNQAVALYHSNDLLEAAKTFYASLSVVNVLLKGSTLDDYELAADTPPQNECIHYASAPQASGATATRNDLFVYQSALVLPESPLPLQETQGMTFYCAVILFNTAVLHHQEGMRTGSSVSMDRATKLYQASLHLVWKIDPATNNTLSLIILAAWNNLVQIEFEYGLVNQAGTRLQVLKTLLQSLKDILPQVFTVDEFEGMLLNTLSAEGVNASTAA
ncbi:MAG: hypothetical protein SGBAC_008782 [Bacillariaceae sp.]